MIAPLRRGHRAVFALLAVLLPLLLFLALRARRPTPPAASLPAELATAAAAPAD